MTPSRVLVLCLGNDLRRDDGVGWKVADALAPDPPPGCTVRKSALSGLHLLDELEGWEQVVVVDAVRTGRRPPGTVLRFASASLRPAAGASPHALGLHGVLQWAGVMGCPLPRRIEVVAVEVEDMHTLAEGLCESVAAAVPRAADAARQAAADLQGGRMD